MNKFYAFFEYDDQDGEGLRAECHEFETLDGAKEHIANLLDLYNGLVRDSYIIEGRKVA